LSRLPLRRALPLLAGAMMARLKTLLPVLLLRRRALLIADHSRDNLAGSRCGSFILVGQ
jgi:hypothetical protein